MSALAASVNVLSDAPEDTLTSTVTLVMLCKFYKSLQCHTLPSKSGNGKWWLQCKDKPRINLRISLASQKMWMLKALCTELTVNTNAAALASFPECSVLTEKWTIKVTESRKLLAVQMRCSIVLKRQHQQQDC